MSQPRRPLRPPRRIVLPKRRGSAGVKAARRSALPLLVILLPLAFFAGRWTVEPPAPAPELEPPRAATSTPAVALPAAVTRTASVAGDCCPCPPPKKPVDPKLVLERKAKPPVEVPTPPPVDPTAQTAKYLRDGAKRLSACAPKTGASLRVHLEITVAPDGKIDRSRITNLDPLPPEVSGCVEAVVSALTPPGFDGSRAEVFALTVVL